MKKIHLRLKKYGHQTKVIICTDNGKNKLFATEKQYLNAQKKAFRIWNKLHEKLYTIHAKEKTIPYFKSYYYVAINPIGEAYVVCDANKINTSTGMFRFYSHEMTKEFIKEMGLSIYNIFPKHKIV